MGNEKSHEDRFEKLMSQMAESVLDLSDNAIIAEIGETGADANQEAEDTHVVLLGCSQRFEIANRRLSNLGHTVNTRRWHRGQGEYTNHCVDCGSLIIFTISSGEVRGRALYEPCSANGHLRLAKHGMAH